MNTLLAVNIGNTTTTAGFFEGGALLRTIAAQTASLRSGEDLPLGDERIRVAAIASVVDGLGAALAARLDRIAGEVLIFGRDIFAPIPSAVRNPESLGADRILGAAAAFERFGGPVVAVDFGTAVTLNAVSGDGTFLGGAIAPGLRMAAGALAEGTSGLPEVEPEAPESAIGRDTDEAIRSGIVLGLAAMVDGMIGRMEEELGGRVRAVATGGDADAVAPHCRRIEATVRHLVLEGLRLACERSGRNDGG